MKHEQDQTQAATQVNAHQHESTTPRAAARSALDTLEHDLTRRLGNIAEELAERAPELHAAAEQCRTGVSALIDDVRKTAADALSSDASVSERRWGLSSGPAPANRVIDAVNDFVSRVLDQCERLADDVSARLDAGSAPAVDWFSAATERVEGVVRDFENVLVIEAMRANAAEREALEMGDVTPSDGSLADQQLSEQQREVIDAATARIIADRGHREPVTLASYPDPSAERGALDHVASFVDGAVRGDFSEDSSTAATVGRILGGLHPAADIRDIAAAVDHVREGKEGAGRDLVIAAVGAIPFGGDAAKALTRGLRDTIEEGIDGLRSTTVRRVGDEAREQAVKAGAEGTAARTARWQPVSVESRLPREPAAPGLGESMIKSDKQSGLNVDVAVQSHEDKTLFREGSGRDVQSAHMVNSSSLKLLSNSSAEDLTQYVRDKALTVLMPREIHKAFDDNWKREAHRLLAEARAKGLPETVSVADWERILNAAADAVPELKGRTADTMHVLIRHELYQTLGLSPETRLAIPFSRNAKDLVKK
jgi:hypothetical protein